MTVSVRIQRALEHHPTPRALLDVITVLIVLPTRDVTRSAGACVRWEKQMCLGVLVLVLLLLDVAGGWVIDMFWRNEIFMYGSV